MSGETICVDVLERVSSTSETPPEACALCGYRSPSEMCPACGGSPAAAGRLEAYRVGGGDD